MSFNEIVLKRLAERHLSRARLVQLVGSGVSRNSVYAFLNGRAISSESLEKIFDALGLRVSAYEAVDIEREKADVAVDVANRIYRDVTERLDNSGELPVIKPKPGGYSTWGAADGERLRILVEASRMIVHTVQAEVRRAAKREVRDEVRRRRDRDGVPPSPKRAR